MEQMVQEAFWAYKVRAYQHFLSVPFLIFDVLSKKQQSEKKYRNREKPIPVHKTRRPAMVYSNRWAGVQPALPRFLVFTAVPRILSVLIVLRCRIPGLICPDYLSVRPAEALQCTTDHIVGLLHIFCNQGSKRL